MKQFFTILKFELDNYFKSKSYVISTILIAVLAAGIMFVPRVKDAITGDKKDSTVQDSTSKEDSSADADAEHTYGVYDPDGLLIIDVDGSVWGSMETGINLVRFDSEDALKKAVEDEKAAAGFAVRSLSDYDYYVYNLCHQPDILFIHMIMINRLVTGCTLESLTRNTNKLVPVGHAFSVLIPSTLYLICSRCTAP